MAMNESLSSRVTLVLRWIYATDHSWVYQFEFQMHNQPNLQAFAHVMFSNRPLVFIYFLSIYFSLLNQREM